MDLHGAGAVVTGGASGIGAACVAQLRAAGAVVEVLDLHESATVPVDVTDERAVVDAIGLANERLSGIDVAVLSAGVGGGAPLLELSTAEWDRVMNVNLRGAFVCLRECARAMRERGGSIVAITSISGHLTERGMAHYSASKAGLAQLVRSAARELGPLGIRVNAIAPGTTDTPMFAVTDQLRGYRERVASRTPLGGVGTAAAVAAAVVAIAPLEWVTGQVVAADGGVSLHSPIDPQE